MAGVTDAAETLAITLPLSLAASIAAAALFHRYVENHFGRGIDVRRQEESRIRPAHAGRRLPDFVASKVAVH
jgi:peptidoglycan/LPS O-acetylase OafA/YrhL